MADEQLYNRLSGDRISSRQVDELIGLARGLCADGAINDLEVEYLQKWLAASGAIYDQPLIQTLFDRVNAALSDQRIEEDERKELFETLNALGNGDFELGEVMKSTTLPLCKPAPNLEFDGRRYTFTGTFSFGQRKDCEQAVVQRGGTCGALTQSTNFLVIGVYATESWKHSSFGNKIIKASEMRDGGIPISIVSEKHWASFL